jgi:hypothetical protein
MRLRKRRVQPAIGPRVKEGMFRRLAATRGRLQQKAVRTRSCRFRGGSRLSDLASTRVHSEMTMGRCIPLELVRGLRQRS